jgi:hypothetical protein
MRSYALCESNPLLGSSRNMSDSGLDASCRRSGVSKRRKRAKEKRKKQ